MNRTHLFSAQFPASVAAIVVLGCAVDGGAFRRRAAAAVEVFSLISPKNPEVRVVATGGRAWKGTLEADALFNLLAEGGVPEEKILRERCSLSTRGNAHFTAGVLHRTGIHEIALVTCDWHMPRAMALFTTAGFDVLPVGVRGPDPGSFWRLYRAVHERVAMRIGERLP
ncbi:MAG: YdcF family protein [Polyangiaceae bacterium]